MVPSIFPAIVLLASAIFPAQSAPVFRISQDDAVRVHEFYRLAPAIEDKIWPHWSDVPAPLLLITPDAEFLAQFPRVPEGFSAAGDGFLSRPRQFPVNLQATMPAFGPPSTICIGEPANSASKDSTDWLIIAMHEHFHQLQSSQPGYYEKVEGLGLGKHGDGGMWMLNYPFPYDDSGVDRRFNSLRDLLVRTLDKPDGRSFRRLAKQYVHQRAEFVSRLSPDDHKYFSFQLWQEGIARYTQVKAAEAAASYVPSPEFQALPDSRPFAPLGTEAHEDTLKELRSIALEKDERVTFYSFGAGEGFLLDRIRPDWKSHYFEHLLSTDALFGGEPSRPWQNMTTAPEPDTVSWHPNVTP